MFLGSTCVCLRVCLSCYLFTECCGVGLTTRVVILMTATIIFLNVANFGDATKLYSTKLPMSSSKISLQVWLYPHPSKCEWEWPFLWQIWFTPPSGHFLLVPKRLSPKIDPPKVSPPAEWPFLGPVEGGQFEGGVRVF